MADPLGLIGGAGGVRPTPKVGPGAQTQQGEEAGSFKDLLMENLSQVDALQKDATQAIEDLQTGKRDDLEGVLVATQQADAAFRMLLQVRNKMLEAYDEIKQIRT